MQNLKVWTFHPVARNTMLFMVLSIILLILQKSLQSSLPFLNLVFLQKSLMDEWGILMISLPAFIITYRHNSNARYFFAIFCAAVIFRSLEGLFLNFNKLLMILLFMYVCMTYTFYQFLTWSFSRAVFSPNYQTDNLDAPMAVRIAVTVSCGEKKFKGYLTNWDHEGAFLYLEEAWQDRNREVTIDILIEGHIFGAKGSVVCAAWDGKGIGVEWNKKMIPDKLSWNALVDLFEDLGWEPRLLR